MQCQSERSRESLENVVFLTFFVVQLDADRDLAKLPCLDVPGHQTAVVNREHVKVPEGY